MLLWTKEKEKFSTISLLFTISFSILIVIGTFYMVFANYELGAVLFSLGAVLVAGNEYLVFKRLRKRYECKSAEAPSKAIEDLLNFAIIAYILPSTLAIFLYFFAEMGVQVLIVVFAGFIITSIKVVSCSIQFYISR